MELSGQPTVVFQAAPFCFGPVSTSLGVAEGLRQQGVFVRWLAEGTALELLNQSAEAEQVVPFSLADAEQRRRCAPLIESAGLVLVNTDPEFADWALGLNPNVVYLDILYWMWDRLPDVVSRCALYVYEDFVRSAEQLARIGLPPRSLRVGPLTGASLSPPPARADHLLVSLGGLHRPHQASRELLRAYEAMVRTALLAALRENPSFKTVYLAGGGLKREVLELDRGTTVHVGCLARAEHQRLLASARAAIVAPGLTTFYEAATAGVPAFFLPPHNYSQYLQLESYRPTVGEAFLCDWASLGVPTRMRCFLPEGEMLDQVDSAIARFVGHPEPLAKRLAWFLGEGHRGHDPLPAQRLVRALFDGSEGGAERVVDEVRRRLTEAPANRADRP